MILTSIFSSSIYKMFGDLYMLQCYYKHQCKVLWMVSSHGFEEHTELLIPIAIDYPFIKTPTI